MRTLAVPLASLLFCAAAGCGGGDDALPLCEVPAQHPLPTEGALISPDQIALPAACVPNGLAELPGRWYVADLHKLFTFSYPRYEGSCATGFRDPTWPMERDDPSHFVTRHVWTDGTRLFTRSWSGFQSSEYVSATVTCLAADGTLAWGWAVHDSERGDDSGTGTGVRFAPMDEPAKGLELVGSLGERAPGEPIDGYNVVVDGGTAFVVGDGGLDAIDVTDPTAPRFLANVKGPEDDGFNDVRVVRGAGHVIAFAAPLSVDQVSVFDVTDPAAPVALPVIPEYAHSLQVVADGDRTLLYLANYDASVPIYDITDPTHPRWLAAPGVPGPLAGVHDLTVDGTMIYANNTTAGLVAVDVSAGLDQPSVLRGRIQTTYSHASWAATLGGRKIVLHGDEGMTPEGGAFMRILDGDPASPTFMQELARWRTRPEVGIHNIEVHGTKAYVAYYQDGVRIVELADPLHPREVAHYNTWDPGTARGGPFEGALGVRLVGGLLYVADLGRGLVILRETP
ncbi:MAG TPA: hypothetical protein VHE35_26735 [Kofleriaceae bacterium]|nr:hypothetical protein [Kofleriaceae bacterium]